jgi:type II secretory pathway pseudopilin PulG
MKRHSKAIHGVTLLEIMLVLAIAAMVIVMSVRYYQTATIQEQINTTLEQVQAIAVAADSNAQTSGSYSTLSNTTSGFTALLPNNWNKTTWAGTISVTGTTSGYTLAIAQFPKSACPGFYARITSNSHYTASTCGSTGTLTITYSN